MPRTLSLSRPLADCAAADGEETSALCAGWLRRKSYGFSAITLHCRVQNFELSTDS